MRVAIFSDVHGNLIALERFLKETRHEADAYVCLGDVVDYGPWNDDCLELVLSLPGLVFIEGNHERLFNGTESLAAEMPLVQAFFHHSYGAFSHPDWIIGLPQHAYLADYRIVHTINGQTIYPDTEVTIAENHMIGHSHHQFQRCHAGYTIINPGSVGQNRKWINVIDYAIFDTERRCTELRSMDYSVDRFIAELKARHYPKMCIDYYSEKHRRTA